MNPDAVATQLARAADLIKNKSDWCQRAYALDEVDEAVGPHSPMARKRCLVAALAVALEVDELAACEKPAYHALEKRIVATTSYAPDNEEDLDPVEWFNDTHTHEEVVALVWDVVGHLKARTVGPVP